MVNLIAEDYIKLINKDRNAAWIYAQLSSGQKCHFNELFKKTAQFRVEIDPDKGLLSKTTFSASLKSLVDIGAIIYEEETSNLRLKPKLYQQSPVLMRELKIINIEFEDSILADRKNMQETLNGLSPKEAVITVGLLAQLRINEVLKSAVRQPKFNVPRFYFLARDMEFLGNELSKAFQNKELSAEYQKTADEFSDKYVDFFKSNFKEVTEKIYRITELR